MSASSVATGSVPTEALLNIRSLTDMRYLRNRIAQATTLTIRKANPPQTMYASGGWVARPRRAQMKPATPAQYANEATAIVTIAPARSE